MLNPVIYNTPLPQSNLTFVGNINIKSEWDNNIPKTLTTDSTTWKYDVNIIIDEKGDTIHIDMKDRKIIFPDKRKPMNF